MKSFYNLDFITEKKTNIYKYDKKKIKKKKDIRHKSVHLAERPNL